MIAQLQRSVEQIDSLLNRNKQQLQGKTMSKSAVGREISVLVNDRRRTGRSMYSSRRSAPSSDTSSVLSDEVLQRRLELENYKEEAAARMVAGRYSQAVDMFTKALQIDRQCKRCLTSRAKCHLRLGRLDDAITDAEEALSLDESSAKAFYVKGEALYQKGDFELALVCYYRAKRLRPAVPEYDKAIQKARCVIEEHVGDVANTRLTNDGDLSTFYESTQKEDDAADSVTEVPSLAETASVASNQTTAVEERKNVKKSNPKTTRVLLEELYGDWQYLERILNEEAERIEELDREEKEAAGTREILLRDRREALILRGKNVKEEDDRKEEQRLIAKDSFAAANRKKGKTLSEAVKRLADSELSYLGERMSFWQQQRQHSGTAGGKLSGTSATRRILATLERIENAQSNGHHKSSLQEAMGTLRTVAKCSENDLPRKMELMATLYSLIGNAYFEMKDYNKALKYYKMDADVAKDEHFEEAECRSLENIGRTLAKMDRNADAIDVFKQRMSCAKKGLESAWLNYEVGHCHMEEREFDSATSCAEKALENANDVDDNGWKLNARVLLAQIQIEQNNNEAAIEHFRIALELARTEKDKDAVAVVEKAINDITEQLKIATEADEDTRQTHQEDGADGTDEGVTGDEGGAGGGAEDKTAKNEYESGKKDDKTHTNEDDTGEKDDQKNDQKDDKNDDKKDDKTHN